MNGFISEVSNNIIPIIPDAHDKWVVNEKEIRLIQKDTSLNCELRDLASSQVLASICLKRGSEGDLKKAFDVFRQTTPVLGAKGFFFTSPKHNWNLGDKKLTLLQTPKCKLIWQLFDQQTKITNWSPFSESLLPSVWCKLSSLNRLKDLYSNEAQKAKTSEPFAQSIDFLKKCLKIVDIEGIAHMSLKNMLPFDVSQTQPNFSIRLEPICAKSKINPNILVSAFSWTVTIITHKGTSNNHSLILIEGLNDGYYNEESVRLCKRHYKQLPSVFHDLVKGDDQYCNKEYCFNESKDLPRKIDLGEYFIHVAHNYVPELHTGLFTGDAPNWHSRSKVWKKESHAIKKLLDHIQIERDEKSSPSFEYHPHSSIELLKIKRKNQQAKDDQEEANCFHWIRPVFKTYLDIDIPLSKLEFIVSLPRSYMTSKTLPPFFSWDGISERVLYVVPKILILFNESLGEDETKLEI